MPGSRGQDPEFTAFRLAGTENSSFEMNRAARDWPVCLARSACRGAFAFCIAGANGVMLRRRLGIPAAVRCFLCQWPRLVSGRQEPVGLPVRWPVP